MCFEQKLGLKMNVNVSGVFLILGFLPSFEFHLDDHFRTIFISVHIY